MTKYYVYIAKKRILREVISSFCDSGRIQTCNLLIRSQMLYSVELRSLLLLSIKCCSLIASAKVRIYFETPKYLRTFFVVFFNFSSFRATLASLMAF